MTHPYTESIDAVRSNLNVAARALNYLLEISSRADADPKLLELLNLTPRFWTDFRAMVVQTVIINLGKIFDQAGTTRSIWQMMNAVRLNLSHFSRASLRQRKMRDGLSDLQILEDVIANAHELSDADLKVLSKKIKAAHAGWEKVKPLREKIFAHHEGISEEDRNALLKQVAYFDLSEIIQGLLDVCFALEIAELKWAKARFQHL